MLVKMQGENNTETKLDNICFKCHSVFRRYRMKKVINIIFLITFFMLFACNDNSNTNISKYKVSVPYYYQIKNDYCVEASTQMVLHYLGDDNLGWKEYIYLTKEEEQEYIHEYLKNVEGKVFYLEHQHGFPTSFNDLLTKYINVKYSNIAYLYNFDIFYELEDMIVYEMKMLHPMISIGKLFGDSESTNLHSVVLYGIDYDKDIEDVDTYYYHDPYYGNALTKSRNEWNIFCCVDGNKYLLLTLDI